MFCDQKNVIAVFGGQKSVIQGTYAMILTHKRVIFFRSTAL